MQIVRYNHRVYKYGIDTHANHNEEALKTECKKASEVVVSDLSPFAVSHCCERNGSDGAVKVNFYHTPVQNNRYQN